jgi:hypothetical protein
MPDRKITRVPNATSANEEDPIEVTQKMIAAGLEALDRHEGGSFAGADAAVYAVFTAMVQACPRFQGVRVVEP